MQINQTFTWVKFDSFIRLLQLLNDGKVDNVVGIATLVHNGVGIVQFALEFVVGPTRQKTKNKSIDYINFQKWQQGTKLTHKFMVIILLLEIKLKATPKGKPTYDFCWKQKSSCLNVVQCKFFC